jgi:hypothetical protein
VPVALSIGGAGVFYTYYFWSRVGRLQMARLDVPQRPAVWLTNGEMQSATVHVHRGNVGKGGKRGKRGKREVRGARDEGDDRLRTQLALSIGKDTWLFTDDDILGPLAAILPVLNAAGASEDEIRRAVTLVDDAEAAAGRPANEPSTGLRDRHGRAAWQRLLEGNQAAAALIHRTAAERLALEMAVSEELERRALAEHAAAIGTGSGRASEVAEIADNMLVPQSVLAWIARFKAARSPPTSSQVQIAEPTSGSGTPESRG